MDDFKAQIRKDLIISVILFLIGIFLPINRDSSFFSFIIQGAMVGGLIYSWKLLTFITPNIFLIMPLIGWVIYFVIKLIIALFIAPFAFCFKTIYNIIQLSRK